jgi:ribonucleoside-diphosphate reductase alpha chain
MIEIHPLFEQLAKDQGFYSDDLMRTIAHQGSVATLTAVPEPVRHLFVTAHDIAPQWHVQMQAAFQEFTDNGVSKTINFPHEAPVSAIEETYWAAYRQGVKGITVYRHNSRQDQPMTLQSPAAADSTGDGHGVDVNRCPECGGVLEATEGCQICPNCAFSPCA